MSLVSLIEWTYVIYASSSEVNNFFPLSLYVWSITHAAFWWDDISSLIFFSWIFQLLILILDSVSVYIFKGMSISNDILVWMLISGRFKFPRTLSLLGVFVLFDSLLLMSELTVVHILFLETYDIFLPCFLLENVNTILIYLIFVK